ncbi:MAG TPA: ATP-binding cassette domain-containing protein, partial [Massilibacterium sp.]|nr:ATP-binding cassette domain-containing protein [Massilibacterium sp.]
MIEICQVKKIFKEKKKETVAVNDVSVTVKKGEIVALLGENGAGKTTLLRMIATLLTPTSGYIKVGGYDTIQKPTEIRKNLGVLFGGETGLYERLTARENLAYFASLYGMKKEETNERIERLSKRFE